MLKGKSSIGKSILSRADGEKVGTVRDLVLARDHSRILALLTEDNGLFSKAQVVPMSKVVSFGKDAVVVVDKASEVHAEDDPLIKESLDSKDRLVGKQVYSERGDHQAKVSDIYFDDATGSLMGMELTGGVLENSQDGTAFLPMESVISIGLDAVVIKAEAVNDLLQQASGTASRAKMQEPLSS